MATIKSRGHLGINGLRRESAITCRIINVSYNPQLLSRDIIHPFVSGPVWTT